MLTQLWLKLGTLGFWLSWPALYILLRRTHRTRVVVRAGGELLLVRSWLSDGHWGLPGGGLHREESAAAGAVRELQEETGLLVEGSAMVDLGTEQLRHRGLVCTCTYFAVDIDRSGALQTPRGEITEARWFRLSQVAAVGFQPEVRRALKLLADQGRF